MKLNTAAILWPNFELEWKSWQEVCIANVYLNLIHFHESSFLLKVTQIDPFSRHVSCSTNYSWPISAWKWGAPSEVDFYCTVLCKYTYTKKWQNIFVTYVWMIYHWSWPMEHFSSSLLRTDIFNVLVVQYSMSSSV